MAIALSPGGSTIYTSPHPSTKLLVATLRGVVILEGEPRASSWRVTGQSLKQLHIHAIIIEPKSGFIFAGARHGSIYASGDGGKTWEKRDHGLTENNVYSLAFASANGQVRLYAGTEPAHLFCSEDLGLKWAELSSLRSVPGVARWKYPAPPHIAHVKHINFDPGNPNIVYASVEQGALLKSMDSGATWEELHGFYEDVHRTVMDPLNPSRIYMSTGDGLFQSTDGGAAWTRLTSKSDDIGGYADGLVLDPTQPHVMFVSAAQDTPGTWKTTRFAGAKISRSQDSGRTWKVLENGLPGPMQPNIDALCLEDAGPTVSLFAGTTSGEIYTSSDGGERWKLAITGLPPVSKGDHYRRFEGY